MATGTTSTPPSSSWPALPMAGCWPVAPHEGPSNMELNFIKVWDAVAGRELRRMEQPNQGTDLAFSADGRRLASRSLSDDGEIHLYDTADWREAALECHNRTIWGGLAFSPDGRTLASGSDDKNDPGLRLWDLRSEHAEARHSRGVRAGRERCRLLARRGGRSVRGPSGADPAVGCGVRRPARLDRAARRLRNGGPRRDLGGLRLGGQNHRRPGGGSARAFLQRGDPGGGAPCRR